jgi:hypothetical protein
MFETGLADVTRTSTVSYIRLPETRLVGTAAQRATAKWTWCLVAAVSFHAKWVAATRE